MEALGKSSAYRIITGDHDLYVMLADNAAQQGDETTLRLYTPLAEESATRQGHTLYQAVAHRARGVLHRLAGEYAAAEDQLNQALELFSVLNTHWQLGRTHYELGQVALTISDDQAARDHFSEAQAAFERMQAAPDAAQARAALETLKSRTA